MLLEQLDAGLCRVNAVDLERGLDLVVVLLDCVLRLTRVQSAAAWVQGAGQAAGAHCRTAR